MDNVCYALGNTLLTDLRDSLTFCPNDYATFNNYAGGDLPPREEDLVRETKMKVNDEA